jgi:hypothetical protein
MLKDTGPSRSVKKLLTLAQSRLEPLTYSPVVGSLAVCAVLYSTTSLERQVCHHSEAWTYLYQGLPYELRPASEKRPLQLESLLSTALQLAHWHNCESSAAITGDPSRRACLKPIGC